MNERERLRMLLPLYDSDELTPQERAMLDEWLQHDPAGRGELQALRALQQRVRHAMLYEPDPGTLQRLRAALVDKIHAEARPRFWGLEWIERRQPAWRGALRLGFAVAVLLAGVLIGRKFFAPAPLARVSNPAAAVLPALLAQQPIATESVVLAPHLAHVHAIRIDAETGQIEIEFSTVNNVSLRGSTEDPIVRQVLAHAMRPQEHTGLRLRAVKAVSESTPAQLAAATDNELIAALLQVLRHDANDGVRLKAVEALKKLPLTDKVKEALIQTLLRDSNAAVRVQAIEALSRYRAEEKIPALEAAAASDSNGYVRLQAVRLLDQLRAEQIQ